MHAVKHIFKVGDRLCEMIYAPRADGHPALRADWSPEMPIPGTFSESELRQYQAGKATMLDKIVIATGKTRTEIAGEGESFGALFDSDD